MSTLSVTKRFIVLLVLVGLTLTGCGGLFSAADHSEPTSTGTVEGRRDADAASAPASAEEPVAAAPVEEKAVVVEVEVAKEAEAPAPEPASPMSDKSEVVAGADSGYATGGEGAADDRVIEAKPLPTTGPSMAEVEMPAEAVEFEESAEESSVAVARQTEPLRAGEVDDNAQWDDYLLYRRDYRGPWVHDRNVSERYVIEVVDGQGRPVLGANVRFFLPDAGGQQRQEIYSVRTYANGRALFHPLALDVPLEQVDRFQVEVQKENVLQQFTLTRFDAQATTAFAERWTVTLDLQQQQFDSLNLDVLFLIDATGSMADEIAKIQSTIFDVSAQVDALPERPNVRYGMVTYRDRGDSFVTRTYEFTPDVRDFSKNLSTVYADGGGDYPESLNEGLHDALHRVEWRGADAVKLIFLVADAPPHLDYAQDYDYAVEMETAARRGIKIFPIASSGLDDQGEYIFRQIAQYTQGRFIFLTYEGPTNAGEPGDVTTHHVDDYSVENLDNLLVRLVKEELAHQNPQLVRAQ